MKLIPQALPRGKAIFCDDIRAELGNKISLMGIYTGSVTIPPTIEFPLTLPRMGIAVFWEEPIEGFSEEIAFKASYVPLDSDPFADDVSSLVETHQNLKEIAKSNPVPARVAAHSKIHTRQSAAYMILSPFVVPHPGKLRVRAYRSDGVWMVGAIAIEHEQS